MFLDDRLLKWAQVNRLNVSRGLLKVQWLVVLVAFLYFLVHIFTFFIFKGDSLITIHDNLDQMIPYFKMLKEQGLLFAFDEPTIGFDGMSTLYYGHVQYNFWTFCYYLFDDFFAYAVIHLSASVFALSGMFLLLRTVSYKYFSVKQNIYPLILVISILFAILPVIPIWNFGVASVPWVVWAFLRLSERKQFDRYSLFLLVLPFFSELTGTGFFVLISWLIGLFIISLWNKQLNINLIMGFLFLLLGYVFVNIKVLYSMLFISEPLNRELIYSILINKSSSLSQIKASFLGVFYNSHYHAPAMQGKYLIPILIYAVPLCVVFVVFFRKNQKKIEYGTVLSLLLILCFAYVFFSALAAFYANGFLVEFFSELFPFVKGFNWGRFFVLNRTIITLVVFICILIITISFSKDKVLRAVVKTAFIGLILWQIHYVASSNVSYNDAFKTAYARYKGYSGLITYNGFFSPSIFDALKSRIGYKGEKTVAFGFEPSVLMYNSFATVDGYNNAYPLSYYRRFRKVIEPELEYDKQVRDYYDSWGGRLYLYDGLSSYNPRFDDYPAVILRINTRVLRDDFNVKYLISRAKVKNALDLNMKLIDAIEPNGTLYKLYTYEII